jgi:hypothetical protein
MTWRDVLAAGLLFLLPSAAMAAAPSAPAALAKTPPMVFYVAKGSPDSCGAGCDSWIAVEGRVDGDTADRFRKFLHPLKDRHLPIYFSRQAVISPRLWRWAECSTKGRLSPE